MIVRGHAFKDYPERGFSQREILNLIRKGEGVLTDNKSAEAIPSSYQFYPKDEMGRECKLVVLIEVIEVSGKKQEEREGIIVCSAYRKVDDGI